MGTFESNNSEIYRYDGGTSWTRVMTTPGQICTSCQTGVDYVQAMGIYNNTLYVGTRESNDAEIARYDGGTTWTRVSSSTPGTINTGETAEIDAVWSMATYNGALYIGTLEADQAEIYRYDNGSGWQRVTNNTSIETKDQVDALIVYNGRLYAGITESSNAETWRYNGLDDSWNLVSLGGGQYIPGGTTGIDAAGTISIYGGYIYQATGEVSSSSTRGIEVFRYKDIEGQSNAVSFRASSDATPGVSDSDTFPNIASIRFVASESAVQNANSSGQTGIFSLTHALSTSAGAYDIAEDYPTRDDSLVPGEVVIVDPYESGFVRKATEEYQEGMVGIYSEKPGFRLSQTDKTFNGGNMIPIALAGRVSVNVSSNSATIQPGDYVTSASESGKIMKAAKAGHMIGKAMEEWTSESGKDKITVFVTATYADPANILQNLVLDEQGKIVVASVSASSVILPSGLQINGEEVNGTLETALTAITDTLTLNTITTNALNSDVLALKTKTDELDLRVTSLEDNTASQAAQLAILGEEIDLTTASTSAQLEELTRRLDQLTASGSASTTPDASPSANPTPTPLSGVTGTLSVPTPTPTITDPQILISSESATFTDISVISTATISGQLTAYAATVHDSFRSFGTSYLGDTTISGSFMVTGQTILDDTSVAGVLAVDDHINVAGTLTISDDTINVSGTPVGEGEEPTDGILYLQNTLLGNLIDIFNGKLTIDKDGNLKTLGNIEIEGDLKIKGGITTTATAGEPITAGDALYISSSSAVMIADAADEDKNEIIGIAAADTEEDEEVTIVTGGKAKGFTNLTVGERYYLGENGTLITESELTPTILTPVSVGVAFSETELLIQIAPAVAGASTGN
jgi:hypothetical protein